jgi:hypothetical protein
VGISPRNREKLSAVARDKDVLHKSSELSEGSSVASLKFIEQFGELEWFEEQPSGAEAL